MEEKIGLRNEFLPALMSLLVFTGIAGIAYPLTIAGIAQVFFPSQANGSIVYAKDGRAVGSEHIGQPFSDPKYFWGRLSATGNWSYNAFDAKKLTGSSGTNYGPLHPDLEKAMKARIEALRQADPENKTSIPVDLVTSSGSGLDPHISPAAAEFQAGRVAKARGVPIAKIQEAIARRTNGRTFGILGESVVSVLLLNRDLDTLMPR